LKTFLKNSLPDVIAAAILIVAMAFPLIWTALAMHVPAPASISSVIPVIQAASSR
jgi:hypothetical protein